VTKLTVIPSYASPSQTACKIMPKHALSPPQFPMHWASQWGEDPYGLWMALTHNGVEQIFRWIEPGEFMMGSPEHEEGRFHNEVLHKVNLTQGLWLADTTVTQALWQAVMEDNPSYFKGDNRPVEQVNWEYAQRFIEKLNQLHPGLQAGLPTEAQWEYACRAGATGPFNVDGELSVDKVNYRGTWEFFHKMWGKGARQATDEVKSYPCNAWGLYEMHGNVWEWCQDYWQEKLSARPAVDPVSQPSVGRSIDDRVEVLLRRRSHVVRGGSWYRHGRYARSAIRYHCMPSDRLDNFGFRLSLGHELTHARSTQAKP